MRVGAVFPQLEIGTDPGRIAEYARAVEALGYTHLVAYDHVLGADTSGRPGWRGPYTVRSAFHEVFVLLGYLAACTSGLELATCVLILPQRQTALVAKQAAALDVLSGGRFRLGVGLGWNAVEYEALGENFHDRGRRFEEQIALLRRLWTEESVDFTGRWHRVDRAGINPMPVQRPIPLWIGADVDVAIRRAARLADGWFSHLTPDDRGREGLERFREWATECGRDPASIGVEGRVHAHRGRQRWAADARAFADMGMTHLEFNTMGARYTSVDDHIAALRAFREMIPA